MTALIPSRDLVASSQKLVSYPTVREPGLPTILGLLAAFVAIWAVYYAFAEAPVAIKHDMAEAYAWGREFRLGYYQHPPFWAWMCGLWFSLFPRTEWAFGLLSSVNAGIGLWGAWMLLGDFTHGSKRWAAWMLLLLTPLYTFYAFKYNANIIFLSIWPWTQHYLMKSLRGRGFGDAVGFGICVGIALMSKYYALILIATCALAAMQHPARWKYLASASPYVSSAVAAAICAPHVWWLLTHQAPPLRYLASVSGRRWDEVVLPTAKALTGALGMNLGVVVVVGLVAWIARGDGRATVDRDSHRLPLGMLATLVLTPLVLTLAGAFALRTGITSEMMIGTFPLLPLLTIELAGVRDIDRLSRTATRLAGVVTLGALLLAPVIAAARTYLSPVAMKIEPVEEVATAATALWHARTSLPLLYVGGSYWYDNAIAFYSADRPHVFARFDYARNLWVTPEALAEHGLLSVCISDDRVCLAETGRFTTPDSTRTEMSLAHEFWGHLARPVHFIVTVIPPRT